MAVDDCFDENAAIMSKSLVVTTSFPHSRCQLLWQSRFRGVISSVVDSDCNSTPPVALETGPGLAACIEIDWDVTSHVLPRHTYVCRILCGYF